MTRLWTILSDYSRKVITEGQSKERQESQADSPDAEVGDVSDAVRIANLVEGIVNLKIEDAVY
ncbi:hypothetical protein YC2023_009038 [Brassica napus]